MESEVWRSSWTVTDVIDHCRTQSNSLAAHLADGDAERAAAAAAELAALKAPLKFSRDTRAPGASGPTPKVADERGAEVADSGVFSEISFGGPGAFNLPQVTPQAAGSGIPSAVAGGGIDLNQASPAVAKVAEETTPEAPPAPAPPPAAAVAAEVEAPAREPPPAAAAAASAAPEPLPTPSPAAPPAALGPSSEAPVAAAPPAPAPVVQASPTPAPAAVPQVVPPPPAHTPPDDGARSPSAASVAAQVDSGAAGPYAAGTDVEYNSQSAGRWITAKVMSYDAQSGTYKLDCHPQALASKVRLVNAAPAAGSRSINRRQTAELPARPSCLVADGHVARLAGGFGASPEQQQPQEQPAQQQPQRPMLQRSKTDFAPVDNPVPKTPGAAVEYYSTTHGGWVPAVVQGFNEDTGCWSLDIQPVALQNKVRAVRQSAPSPSAGLADPSAPAAPPAPPLAQPPAALQRPMPAVFASEDGPRPKARPQAPPAAQGFGGRPQRPCGFCQAVFVVDDLLGPQCDHLFCGPCLRGHVLGFDFLRQKVCCPSCDTEITALQVQYFVGEEAYAARQVEMEREDEAMARRMMEEAQAEAEAEQREHEQRRQQRFLDQQQQEQEQRQQQQQQQQQQQVHELEQQQQQLQAQAQVPQDDLAVGGMLGGAVHPQPQQPPGGGAVGAWLGGALQPAPPAGQGVGAMVGGWMGAMVGVRGGSEQPPPAEPARPPPAPLGGAVQQQFAGAAQQQVPDLQAQPQGVVDIDPVLRRPCHLCKAEFAHDSLLSPVCEHLFCEPCLKRHTMQSDFVREKVLCPAAGCGAELMPEQVQHLVGVQEFQRRRAQIDEDMVAQMMKEFAAEDQANAGGNAHQFECPLCFDTGPRDEAIELDCNHRFCSTCFCAYLESKIMDGQVADDELVCPIPKCTIDDHKVEITVAQIEGATAGTPLWDKFLQFRMKLWKPGSADGQIVECPDTGCRAQFVVPPGEQFVHCPMCKKEFCAKCGFEKHEGVTCEQFKAWQDSNDNADHAFLELMANEQWRKCPGCEIPSERESGCNFMQCRSQICRKRTYWCYVCGKKLTRDDHYSHYPRGPYEDECHTPLEDHIPIAPPPPPRPAAGEGARARPAPAGGQPPAAAAEEEGGVLGALRGWLQLPLQAA